VAAVEFDGPAGERSCRLSAVEIGGKKSALPTLAWIATTASPRAASRPPTSTGPPDGPARGRWLCRCRCGSGDQGRRSCEVSGTHEVALMDL
jgi:hypothetical protein